jgi:hypothetical protein
LYAWRWSSLISLRTKVRICVQTTLYIQIIQSIIQCFLRQKYWLFYRTTWLWVNCLPFARTCVHCGFRFLGGVCLTLRKDLCSLRVLFSWWGLSYPSRGSVFTPGFVFLVGSVFPFSRICAHSRFCFLGGGLSYPSRRPVFTPGFVFLVGVCLTLPGDLCSLQVLFSWWGSVLPFARTCVHCGFRFLGGVCLTLPGDLCSLQVLFSWWVLFCSSL